MCAERQKYSLAEGFQQADILLSGQQGHQLLRMALSLDECLFGQPDVPLSSEALQQTHFAGTSSLAKSEVLSGFLTQDQHGCKKTEQGKLKGSTDASMPWRAA